MLPRLRVNDSLKKSVRGSRKKRKRRQRQRKKTSKIKAIVSVDTVAFFYLQNYAQIEIHDCKYGRGGKKS